MQISCKSDIGRMRSQNQDSVFASDKPGDRKSVV